MFAALGLAIVLLAQAVKVSEAHPSRQAVKESDAHPSRQEPGKLDSILDRHTAAARGAKTFDELAVLARKTLAAILALLESKPDAETAARGRAIASDICADLDDYGAAEAHAKAFLETWPKHKEAPLLKMTLGQVRAAAGKDAAAREAFQSLIRDHPEDSRVFDAKLRIAQSFLCEGLDDEAVRAFVDLRASHKGKPEEWSAAIQHALSLQVLGKPGEGRALLEEVVRSCNEARVTDYAKRALASWLRIGKPAKPVEGWDLKEKPVKLDLSGGKVTVLYFMGTAFPDFTLEAGMMRRLAKRFPPSDVSVLAVALDKDKAKLEADLALVGANWPVVFDGNGFKGPIATSYGLDTLPMVLLIDRKNVVRYVNPASGDHAREIGRCVQVLLGEK